MPLFTDGREGFKEAFATVRSTFPDYQSIVEDEIAKGDKVVIRYTSRGTHQGGFMGFPPIDKEVVSFTGIAVWRMSSSKLVERWNEADIMSVMRQLDVVPAPDQ